MLREWQYQYPDLRYADEDTACALHCEGHCDARQAGHRLIEPVLDATSIPYEGAT